MIPLAGNSLVTLLFQKDVMNIIGTFEVVGKLR